MTDVYDRRHMKVYSSSFSSPPISSGSNKSSLNCIKYTCLLKVLIRMCVDKSETNVYGSGRYITALTYKLHSSSLGALGLHLVWGVAPESVYKSVKQPLTPSFDLSQIRAATNTSKCSNWWVKFSAQVYYLFSLFFQLKIFILLNHQE